MSLTCNHQTDKENELVDTGWSRMKIMIGEINGMIMEMGREYKGVLKGVGEGRGSRRFQYFHVF